MNIEDLLPKVIQSIQTNGQVRPTVYAEYRIPQSSDQEGQAQPSTVRVESHPLFNFYGDGRQKAHLLFTLGRETGQKHLEQQISEIVFTTEIWLTFGQRNPNPGHRPPATIPSKEAVMLLVVSGQKPYSQAAKIYEIKRDKHKKAKELVLLEDNAPVEGMQAQAFIAGHNSRTMTDQEVAARQPRGMRAFLE
jgi:hypothetical protein